MVSSSVLQWFPIIFVKYSHFKMKLKIESNIYFLLLLLLIDSCYRAPVREMANQMFQNIMIQVPMIQ